ncbi:hypothetical protein LINPERPRIM_LOCUS19450, partial [Linum perenne]
MARGDSDAFLGPGFRFHPTDGNSSATTSSGRSLTSRYGLTRFPLLMSTDRSPGISLLKSEKGVEIRSIVVAAWVAVGLLRSACGCCVDGVRHRSLATSAGGVEGG